MADLVDALSRHGSFLHPITVRVEGAARYRLIAGRQRLEAWRRCFGEERGILAIIYPSDTPEPLITSLEIQKNLLRKELTTAEREARRSASSRRA